MVERQARDRIRLGDAVTAARKHPSRGWRQAELAEHAHIGLRSVVKVESGEKVSPKTLRAIESALDWEAGSADTVLNGGEPTLIGTSAGVAVKNRQRAQAASSREVEGYALFLLGERARGDRAFVKSYADMADGMDEVTLRAVERRFRELVADESTAGNDQESIRDAR